MEHEIVEKEAFLTVGLPKKVTLKDPEFQKKIGELWSDFMPRAGEIKNRKGELFYGLCDCTAGFEGDPQSFETIAVVEVESDSEIPEGMKAQQVPAAKYLMVTHKGGIASIPQTYENIHKMLEQLNLKQDIQKISFELYDERFKPDSEDSAFDIYTPLVEE